MEFQYQARFKGKENQEAFFSVMVIALPNQLSVYRASLCVTCGLSLASAQRA